LEQGGECPAPGLLEFLRQLPRDRRGPIPQYIEQVPDRPLQPVRGLEEDDGPRLAAQLLDARAAAAASPREETLDREPVGGQSRDLQRAERARRARNRYHRGLGLHRSALERKVGVRDARRARVGDDRDRGPLTEARDQLRRARVFVVIVVGDQGLVNVEAREQRPCVARVLGRDQVDAAEDLSGPRGEILHIPDRRAHEVERARDRLFAHRFARRTDAAARRIAAMARSIPASSTSRWVTARKRPGPPKWTSRTPSAS